MVVASLGLHLLFPIFSLSLSICMKPFNGRSVLAFLLFPFVKISLFWYTLLLQKEMMLSGHLRCSFRRVPSSFPSFTKHAFWAIFIRLPDEQSKPESW